MARQMESTTCTLDLMPAAGSVHKICEVVCDVIWQPRPSTVTTALHKSNSITCRKSIRHLGLLRLTPFKVRETPPSDGQLPVDSPITSGQPLPRATQLQLGCTKRLT